MFYEPMKTTLLINTFVLSRYLDISMKLTVDIGDSEKCLNPLHFKALIKHCFELEDHYQT